MEITFSMEKFPRLAVGFRWKDQDASRARIFSWSGVFVPVTSVHWLPSDHGLDSGSIFNSWMKVMKYISPYRAIQRFLEDDQNVDFVQIGVNKKILSLAEDEFGLLKFGKRAD